MSVILCSRDVKHGQREIGRNWSRLKRGAGDEWKNKMTDTE